MSATVDNRIVEMQFDNKQFESGVATSIKSLDELKESLKFEDSSKGLENLQKSIQNIDTSSMINAAEAASDSFSAFEIASITAIANVVNKAVDAGLSLAKALAIDPITTGFDAYEDSLKKVQTIMTATGEDIKTVEDELARVTWYADETSYSFEGMVDGIEKFTAQGISLHDSASYLQGISNMAAFVGASVTDATHAYEGFSKAMSAGAMNRQNWMWIRTAHMETVQIKEAFADTAVECERLQKVAGGYYDTVKEKTFTLNELYDNLKNGWMDDEVMAKTFGKWAEYSDILKLYTDNLEFATEKNFECSTVMEVMAGDFENIDDATREIVESNHLEWIKEGLEAVGKSAEDDNDALEKFNEILKSNSQIGFTNGQMYRTLGDAIDATKTAVASGWKEIFNSMFGNALEARELWTEVGGIMYDVFVTRLDEVKEVFKKWHSENGFQYILNALYELEDVFGRVFGPIRDAFYELIPTPTLKQLHTFFKKLNILIDKLDIGAERSQDLRDILSSLVGPLSIINTAFEYLTRTLSAILILGKTLFSILIILGSALVANADAIKNYVTETLGFGKVVESLSAVVKTAGEAFNKLLHYVTGTVSIQKPIDLLVTALSFLGKAITSAGQAITGLLCTALNSLANINIDKIATGLGNVATEIGNFFTKIKMGENLRNTVSAIVSFVKSLGDAIAGLIANLNLGETIVNVLGAIVGALYLAGNAVVEFATKIQLGSKLTTVFTTLISILTKFGAKVVSVFNDVVKYIGSFGSKVNSAVNAGNSFGSVASTFEKFIGVFTKLKNAIVGLFDSSVLSSIGTFKKSCDSVSAACTAVGNNPAVQKTADGVMLLSTALTKTENYSNVDRNNVADTLTFLSDTVDETGKVLEKKPISIGESLKSFGQSVLEFAKTIKLSDVIFIASLTLAVTGILTVLNTIREINYLIDSVAWMAESLARFVRQTNRIRFIKAIALAVVEIAAAVALVAHAMKSIAEVPASELITAAVTLGAMATLISAIAIAFGVLGGLGKLNLKGVGTSMLSLGVTLTLLSASIKMLSGITKEDLSKSLSALSGISLIVLGLTVVAGLLTKNSVSITGLGSTVRKLSSAISALVIPVIILGALPDGIVDEGIARVEEIGAFIGVFTVVTALISKASDGIVKAMKGIALLSLAINLLVVPITIIGLLPGLVLLKGLLVVGILMTLFTHLSQFMAIAGAVLDNKSLNAICKSLVSLAFAMDLMAIAIAIIGHLSDEEVGQGSIIVMSLIALMSFLGYLFTKTKVLSKGCDAFGKTMIELAVALDLLTAAIAILGYLCKNHKDVIDEGGKYVALLMGIMGGLGVLFHKCHVLKNGIDSFGKTMVALAGAITLMTVPIMLLGYAAVHYTAQTIAGTALVVILGAALTAVAYCVSKMSKLKGSTAALKFASQFFLSFAATIAVIAVALVAMEKLDLEKAGENAAALSLVVIAIGGALALAAKFKVDKSVALSMAAASLCIAAIAGAIWILKDIPFVDAISPAAAMGTVLLMICMALKALASSTAVIVTAAASIAIVTGCILALAAMLYLIRDLDPETMMVHAATFALVIGVISACLGLLAPVSAGVLMAGGGIALVCAGLLALAIALNTFANINTEGLTNVVHTIKDLFNEATIGGMIKFIGVSAAIAVSGVLVGVGLTAFGAGLLVLAAGVGTILLIVNAISLFVIACSDIVHGVTTVGGAIGTFFTTVDTLGKEILAAIGNVVTSIAAVIFGALEGTFEEINLTWVALTIGAEEALWTLRDNLITWIKEAFEKLSGTSWEDISKFMSDLWDKVVKFLEDLPENIATYAANIVNGFVNGIQDTALGKKVSGAAEWISDKFDKAFTGFWEINSPSKRAWRYGAYFDQGFIYGVDDGGMDVEKAAEDIAKAAAEGLGSEEAIGDAEDAGEDIVNAAADSAEEQSWVMKLIGRVLGEDFAKALKEAAGDGLEDILDAFNGFEESLSLDELGLNDLTENLEKEIEDLTNGIENGGGDANDAINSVGDAAEGSGKKTTKTLKTFEELVETYSFGSEAIEAFAEKYEEAIHKVDESADVYQVASYSVANLATAIYEANGGILDVTYATQEELEQILSDIADSYNNTANNLYNTFAGIDPWSTMEENYDTNDADIDKVTNQMGEWADLAAEYAYKMEEFMKDERVSTTMKESIAAMGFEGFKYINMFDNATDEQVENLMDHWDYLQDCATTLTGNIMGEWAAGMTGVNKLTEDNMAYITAQINKGMETGLNVEAGTENATKMAFNVLEAMRQTLEIASPSKAVQQIGEYVGLGFYLGILSEISHVKEISKSLALAAIDTIKLYTQVFLSNVTDSGEDIGLNLVKGMEKGVLNTEARSNLCRAVQQVCDEAIQAARDATGEKSPSKVFAQIGSYLDIGLAQGIEQDADVAASAASSLAENTVHKFSSTISRIAGTMDAELDYNPVIRPILDLSDIERGARQIGSLLDTDANYSGYADENQNGGGTAGNGVQFIQNNYSPKALSAQEIYRQTKNEFAFWKEMVST